MKWKPRKLPLPRQYVAFDRLWWAALAASGLAMAFNFAFFYSAPLLVGNPLAVTPLGSSTTVPLGEMQIISASFVPAALAAAVLVALPRFTPVPFTAFWFITVFGLAVSLYFPLTQPISVDSKMILCSMHAITAIAISTVFTLLTRSRKK